MAEVGRRAKQREEQLVQRTKAHIQGLRDRFKEEAEARVRAAREDGVREGRQLAEAEA